MTKGVVVAVSDNCKFIDVKIIDHINEYMIGNTFHELNPKYFELVEETAEREAR